MIAENTEDAFSKMKDELTDLRDSVILDNVGHWIQRERPEQVSTFLIKFLKSVDKP
jgi:pimeloyl-ACP methyl ester carboxylesterase